MVWEVQNIELVEKECPVKSREKSAKSFKKYLFWRVQMKRTLLK